MKVLEGTFRKDRDKDAPEPELALPDPPPGMGEIALREWHRMAPLLYTRGLLAEDYRDGLACYCHAFDRLERANAVLNDPDPETGGLTFKMPSGYIMQRPEVGIASAAADQMRKFMAEYGLTPAQVTRVTANRNAGGGKGNKFAGIGATGA